MSGLIDLEELVNGGTSDRTSNSRQTYTFKDLFYSQAPYYLSIGMTANEYWNEDVEYVVHYRKAWKIKQDRLNQQLWLQGMYVYDALLDTPIVVSGFAKKGEEKRKYPTEPYALTVEQQKQREADKERAHQMEIKNKLVAFASQFNKKMRDKEGKS